MSGKNFKHPNLKIDLVFPPSDDDYKGIGHIYPSTLPPTNLAILAAVAHEVRPDAAVSILDGNKMSIDTIQGAIGGDIIGISSLSVNQKNVMRLCVSAREKYPEALILLGGPNASHLASRILRNQPCVDAVVCDDGELAFAEIISGKAFPQVSNLVYRAGNEIKITPKTTVSLADVPLFDFEDLMPNFSSERVPVPISSIRGCIQAAHRGACRYCSIRNLCIRVAPPERVWQQIALLMERYGINYVFETGDEFVVGDFPLRLLSSRPNFLSDTIWRIYSYPGAMTQNAVDTLQKLNVRTVFLGVETITKRALHLAGRKDYCSSEIEKIFERARSNNLRLIVSFIFGLLGEDLESTITNQKFIEKLVTRYHDVLDAVSLSVATPVAGSQLFQDIVDDPILTQLYRERTGQQLELTDLFDYEELSRIYVENRTGLDYDWLLAQINQCRDFVEKNDIISSNYMGVENEMATAAG